MQHPSFDPSKFPVGQKWVSRSRYSIPHPQDCQHRTGALLFAFNPNGIPSQSPGLRRLPLPRVSATKTTPNPNGVVFGGTWDGMGFPGVNHDPRDTTPLGLDDVVTGEPRVVPLGAWQPRAGDAIPLGLTWRHPATRHADRLPYFVSPVPNKWVTGFRSACGPRRKKVDGREENQLHEYMPVWLPSSSSSCRG